MTLLPVPQLHVVTNDGVLARDEFLRQAREVMAAGGGRLALHVRGPRSAGRALYHRASKLRDAARKWGASLLVNDRVDVALAARVDGAHLGERSLPVDLARELLGAQRMVGASVHGRDALVAVTAAGASFAFLGMVFPSASHPGRTGIGIGGFSAILDEGQPIPVLGIGGIDTARVGAVLKAGAHGVAVLSGIWERSDPASAVLDYLTALDTVQDQPSGFAKRREAMEETR